MSAYKYMRLEIMLSFGCLTHEDHCSSTASRSLGVRVTPVNPAGTPRDLWNYNEYDQGILRTAYTYYMSGTCRHNL